MKRGFQVVKITICNLQHFSNYFYSYIDKEQEGGAESVSAAPCENLAKREG